MKILRQSLRSASASIVVTSSITLHLGRDAGFKTAMKDIAGAA